jgi:hypothetical protein
LRGIMALVTILTNEFCLNAIDNSESFPERMTAEQLRYLMYFEEHPNLCIVEGSRMIVSCNEHTCINPEHVKILPPLYN